MAESRPGSTAGLRALCAALALCGAVLLAGCGTTEVPAPPQAPQAPQPPAVPWQAAIGELDTGIQGVHCSAVLVARDLIVTASHCLFLATAPRPTKPTQIVFKPNQGAALALPQSRGVAVKAMGAQIRGGRITQDDVPLDWALIQISPPVRGVPPIPVISLTIDGMLDRIRAGARLVTLGYGNGAYDTAVEHDECRLLSHQDLGFRPDDRWLPLSCWIRTGDSGGGVLLIDRNGRPQMVGILAGFTTKPMKVPGPMAFGTNAGNFAPYVGLPVAGIAISPALMAELTPTTPTN
ncbi:MAG TPA: serine protease [Dongiaceae bacterium]|nr:serine protease [Dongiaceae bacterium]